MKMIRARSTCNSPKTWLTLLLLVMTSNGSEVDLFIEGGKRLVGSHCPESVRLFCRGTGLTLLRWSFNEDTTIATFTPDDSVQEIIPTIINPAFLTVELTNVAQNGLFGDFSSTLTVDVSELVQQRVTNIKCGDPVTSDEENIINLDISEPTIPQTPVFSGLQAIQHEMESRTIKVSWNKVTAECQEFTRQIQYEVTIAGGLLMLRNNIMGTSEDCDMLNCSVTFTFPTALSNYRELYQIALLARNSAGMSETATFEFKCQLDTESEVGKGSSNNGSVLAAGIAVTFVLSCTIGLLFGAGTYYIISKKIVKGSNKNSKQKLTTQERRTNMPSQMQREQELKSKIEYAEPWRHVKQDKSVELTRNQAYGQGRQVSTTQDQELEHSYEYPDQ